MKKVLLSIIALSMLTLGVPAFAQGTHGVDGEVSGRSVGAAALSLLIWPGIGQAVNKNTKEKKCYPRSFRIDRSI